MCSEKKPRTLDGVQISLKPTEKAKSDLDTISDEALYDRARGVETLIENEAIALRKLNNELWRRYKRLKADYTELLGESLGDHL